MNNENGERETSFAQPQSLDNCRPLNQNLDDYRAPDVVFEFEGRKGKVTAINRFLKVGQGQVVWSDDGATEVVHDVKTYLADKQVFAQQSVEAEEELAGVPDQAKLG